MRGLRDRLGSDADALAIRIEACRSVEEFRYCVREAERLIATALGSDAAQDYLKALRRRGIVAQCASRNRLPSEHSNCVWELVILPNVSLFASQSVPFDDLLCFRVDPVVIGDLAVRCTTRADAGCSRVDLDRWNQRHTTRGVRAHRTAGAGIALDMRMSCSPR